MTFRKMDRGWIRRCEEHIIAAVDEVLNPAQRDRRVAIRHEEQTHAAIIPTRSPQTPVVYLPVRLAGESGAGNGLDLW